MERFQHFEAYCRARCLPLRTWRCGRQRIRVPALSSALPRELVGEPAKLSALRATKGALVWSQCSLGTPGRFPRVRRQARTRMDFLRFTWGTFRGALSRFHCYNPKLGSVSIDAFCEHRQHRGDVAILREDRLVRVERGSKARRGLDRSLREIAVNVCHPQRVLEDRPATASEDQPAWNSLVSIAHTKWISLTRRRAIGDSIRVRMYCTANCWTRRRSFILGSPNTPGRPGTMCRPHASIVPSLCCQLLRRNPRLISTDPAANRTNDSTLDGSPACGTLIR